MDRPLQPDASIVPCLAPPCFVGLCGAARLPADAWNDMADKGGNCGIFDGSLGIQCVKLQHNYKSALSHPGRSQPRGRPLPGHKSSDGRESTLSQFQNCESEGGEVSYKPWRRLISNSLDWTVNLVHPDVIRIKKRLRCLD